MFVFADHCKKGAETSRKVPGGKPDQYDLSRLLAVAYRVAFQPTTACNNFGKTGFFPFKRDSLSDYANVPSQVMERKDPNGNEAGTTSRDEENSVTYY
jgi:hypothetical protein